jgi:O-antigen ligase
MHPTYYSIYLLTAFILQIELKLIKKKNWILNLFLILTIAFGIILTNSKSGILCFILLCIYYIVKLVITTKEFYINKVISLLIIIFFTSTLIIVNKKGIKNSRLQELTTILNFPVQKEYTNFYNSTEIRIIIWRSVKEVIINNKLFGTGTGDIKDELKKEFYKVRFINGVENNYNCHNQYLQIISTFGIILGSFVIILFINYLYQNIKNKNKIAIIFTLIFLFNSIFESTLESKAGLELFVLFCLVLTQNKSTTNENNRIIVN